MAPSYWLTYDERPGYLLARVGGLSDSRETSISFWQEIGLEARARNVRRLLVQENFRNFVNPADTFDISRFVAELFERLEMPNVRIAFLDEQPDQLEANRAGERAATDYGLCVKAFADLSEAEAWLLAE